MQPFTYWRLNPYGCVRKSSWVRGYGAPDYCRSGGQSRDDVAFLTLYSTRNSHGTLREHPAYNEGTGCIIRGIIFVQLGFHTFLIEAFVGPFS